MSDKENSNSSKDRVQKPGQKKQSKGKRVIKENVKDNNETTGSTGPQKTNNKIKK